MTSMVVSTLARPAVGFHPSRTWSLLGILDLAFWHFAAQVPHVQRSLYALMVHVRHAVLYLSLLAALVRFFHPWVGRPRRFW